GRLHRRGGRPRAELCRVRVRALPGWTRRRPGRTDRGGPRARDVALDDPPAHRPPAGAPRRASRRRERLHRAPEGLVARVGDHGRRAHEADDDHRRRRPRLARARYPLCRALPGAQLPALAARAATRARARARARMTVVETRALRTHRGSTEVLGGIDLAVRRGEVVAIVGPSGSGKTTLLRALNYLTPFTAGEVDIAGHSL